MNRTKEFISNSIYLFWGQIIGQVVLFAAAIYIANYFGPRGFGLLNFALAVVSYLILFSTFGLTTVTVREIAKDKSSTNVYITNTVLIRLSIAIILVGLGLFLFPHIKYTFEKKLILLIYGVTAIPMAFDIAGAFDAYGKMRYESLILIGRNILYASLVFIAISFFKLQEIYYITIFYLIAVIFYILLEYIIFHKKINPIKFTPSINRLKKILFLALPIAFATFMIQIYLNVDIIMLNIYKGDVSVGIYSSACKIILFLSALTSVIWRIAFPLIAETQNKGKEETVKILKPVVKLASIITIPVIFGGIFVGRDLILFLYRVEYIEATLPFKILLLNIGIVGVGTVFGTYFLAFSKQKEYTCSVIIGAITNIILNFLLIPRYSFTGAAIATVAAQLSIVGYGYLQFKKMIRLNIMKYLYKPIIGSIGMLTLLFFFKNIFSLLPLIGIGMIIYFLLLLSLKTFTKGEIQKIRYSFIK